MTYPSFDRIFEIYNRPRGAAINDAILDLGIRTEYADNSVYLQFYRQTVMLPHEGDNLWNII